MTQAPLDALTLWRDMLSKWQTGLNEVAGRTMAPPEFMAELMGRYLTAMNMPSRNDLAELDKRLDKIEHRLAELSAHLERMTDGRSARGDRERQSKNANGPAGRGKARSPAPQAKPGRKATKRKPTATVRSSGRQHASDKTD